MKIVDDLLTPNEWSRGGERIKGVKAVVLHWTANNRATAKQNRDFFESRKGGAKGYGSAHYIVGWEGEVVRCIPESEVAYHSGADRAKGQLDPASGRLYTDESRRRFGAKPNGDGWCPNPWCIGIELCNINSDGAFAAATLSAAAELCADILKRYGLGVDALTTHHNLVGWKDCPKLWTEKPELFEDFKARVAALMGDKE